MSGAYLGKDWGPLPFFLDLYEVEDRKTVVDIMKMYEARIITYRAEQAERKRKQEQSKQNSGGKNYAHNVKG